MIWFIIGYCVVALIANMTTAVITIRKLRKHCKEWGIPQQEYERVMKNTIDRPDQWLEHYIPLPSIFDPLIKIVFFPFNISASIQCYREALEAFKTMKKTDSTH